MLRIEAPATAESLKSKDLASTCPCCLFRHSSSPVGRPRKSSSTPKLPAGDSLIINSDSSSSSPKLPAGDLTPPRGDLGSHGEQHSEQHGSQHGSTFPDDETETNELTAESTVQTRAKLAALTTPPWMIKQFLHVAIPKRNREAATDEEERDEHRDNIARAMMALLAQDVYETGADEWALAAGTSNKADRKFVDRLVIPVPESYEDAINDPVWGKLWLEAIQAELTALIANGTWDVVVPPEDANIVISK